MPNIIDEIIKLFCSKNEEEIWEAAHSLTPQPLIENGTIPIKFRKIDKNKSLKLKGNLEVMREKHKFESSHQKF